MIETLKEVFCWLWDCRNWSVSVAVFQCFILVVA